MTGEPTPPGLDSVKVSLAQSPMAPPKVVEASFSEAVPTVGPSMVKLCSDDLKKVSNVVRFD